VATRPLKVILFSLLFSLSLSMGITKYKVTTDPVDLWVASDSQARQDMEFFNENFWKFYRIEQLILAPKQISNFTGEYQDENDDPIKKQFSSLFKREVLKEAFELQKSIEELTILNEKTGRQISLKDICYQPISGKCATQSLFTYFANNFANLDDENYLERIMVCPENPTYWRGEMSCMEKNGIPLIYPEVALGGFNDKQFHKAKALIITFPINNYKEAHLNEDAILFENAFLNHLKNYIQKTNLTSHFDISYKAEKSIEDELDRQSQSDVGTVIVSYVIMFVYILLALGENDRGCLLLNTKCTIGLAGILVVILSVINCLGVFFFLGIPCTLIIVEVIPFLVLAVGIDNLFILGK
jgi:Niemann-Pick C1 protein